MTLGCTFSVTVTVMEMKHTQEYLLHTLSPPVVYRECRSGGGRGHGAVAPGLCVGRFEVEIRHVAVYITCLYIICLYVTYTQVAPVLDVGADASSCRESLPCGPHGEAVSYSTPVRPSDEKNTAATAVGQKKTRTSVSLPLPSGSASPVPGSVPMGRGGDNSWVFVAHLDLTRILIDDFCLLPDRTYTNCHDYCVAEWDIIQHLVFLALRESTLHDCFWLFKEKTAIPVFNVKKAQKKVPSQWNQVHNAYPPVLYQSCKGIQSNKYEITGFQYKCDHRIQTGCSCKLR